MEFDRATLSRSAIPWAHRGKIGRVRAYLATVWMIAIDSKRIWYELARPQDPKDSRWFRWATGAMLGLVMAGLFVLGVSYGGYEAMAIQPQDVFSPGGAGYPGWMQDLAVPWSAGATIKPVLPMCLVILGFALTRAPRSLLRPGRLKAYEQEHRRRALAMGDYLCGPLLYVAATGVLSSALASAIRAFEERAGPDSVNYAFGLAMVLPQIILVLVVVFLMIRAGQWTARATHRGFLMGLWGAIELAGLWVLSVVMCAGFLPWAVGFFWIVIDSFRV